MLVTEGTGQVGNTFVEIEVKRAWRKKKFQAKGPDLKPTHDAQYWAEKTRGFDFSEEDRVPAELYNKILWEGLKGTPAPVASNRSSNVDADNN